MINKEQRIAEQLLAQIEQLQSMLAAARESNSAQRYYSAKYLLAVLYHILQEPLRPFPTGEAYIKEKVESAIKPYGLRVIYQKGKKPLLTRST